MRNPTLTRAFGAIAVVAAFALGIAVFVQSVRGQDAGAPPKPIPYPTADPNATPTFTADQISELSERGQREENQMIDRMVDELIASSASVAGVSRAESNSFGVAPEPFSAVVAAATGLVVGTVKEQTLFRAGDKHIYLVSAIATDAGGTQSVAQQLSLELNADGSLLFMHPPSVVLLEATTRYALLVAPSAAVPFDVSIRGQVFAVSDLGSLSIEGVTPPSDSPSTLVDLRRRFEASRAQ